MIETISLRYPVVVWTSSDQHRLIRQVLLHHQVDQLLQVRVAHVGGDEPIALAAPVREAGVEDG
eukprot:CAMPEP_0179261528 /NCGR_PEP_ID=MMETSP0797-20121207/26909_1 /TAXON_ID=47934 /ORGANISM="Dinophysis acuminata, Strain DAEP01" /LENGTH=63 /DNA_ID=CAMNT_0020969657 /DNA_START=23 /DNA_END=210 /DNA_ORIENTATION=+